MIGRFWITYAMTSCNYFIYEIFPTTLRSQGSSLATVFASGSQFFSPYIVYSVRMSWKCCCFNLVSNILKTFRVFSIH